MTPAAAKGADTPTFQPPTVGRIVHFYDRTDGPPLAAIVAKVWNDDGLVNLSVVNEDGTTGPRTSVQYHDGGDTAVKSHSWRWPPRA